MFDHIISWKLLEGSHVFPGPDGGTCVTEAAIVAAGLKYRMIDRAANCPRCFSRPIVNYAIGLNDFMPDDIRNSLLLPFVFKLAGTADTRQVEAQRHYYLVSETMRRIKPKYRVWTPATAATVAMLAAHNSTKSRKLAIYKSACAILDVAIKLGNHRGPQPIAIERLEKAKFRSLQDA